MDLRKFTAITLGVAGLHGLALWALHGYRVPATRAYQANALATRTIEQPQRINTMPDLSVLPQPESTVVPDVLPSPPPELVTPQPTPLTTQPVAAPKVEQASSTPPSDLSDSVPASSLSSSSVTTASAAPVVNILDAAAQVRAEALAAQLAAKTPVQASNTLLPTIDADHADTQYRHPRPAISMRLSEAGRVVVHVQVGVDGKALQVQLLKSSGYTRLDNNAMATVARWRFKPGMRGGVPEVMWVDQSVRYDAP